MTLKASVLAATALVGVGAILGGIAPASAEFFGCNDPHARRAFSYPVQSYSAPYRRETHHAASVYTVQPTRHAAYSERSYRRVSDQWR